MAQEDKPTIDASGCVLRQVSRSKSRRVRKGQDNERQRRIVRFAVVDGPPSLRGVKIVQSAVQSESLQSLLEVGGEG